MKSWINIKLTILCIIAFTILLNSCSSDETEVFGGLHGNVTDVNGDGMQNVSVTLNPEGKKTTTGSDGRYEYSNLKAGQYTLQFVKDGFNTDVAQTTIISGQTAKTDMILKEGDGTLKLSINELIFGKGETDNLPFEIHNTGKVNINWQITTPNVAWIKSVTPLSATTAPNRKSSIVVAIDRAKLVAGTSTYSLVITSNSGSATLLVKASNDVEIVDPEKPGETGAISVPAGLLAYYTFDNQNGDDATTNVVEANFVDSPTFNISTPSGKGKSVFLNGTKNEYLNIPQNLFNGLKTYSASMWVKSIGSGVIFTCVGSSYISHDSPRLIAGTDRKFTFHTGSGNYSGTSCIFSYGYDIIQDESWHLITIVSIQKTVDSDGCDNLLYIDGKLKDTSSSYNIFTATKPTKMQIGGNQDGKVNASSSMSFDNVRFYNRALTAADVKTIYDSEKQ